MIPKPERTLFEGYDLVVRKEGALFRVVRSRFHARGDLLTPSVFALVSTRTSPGKVLILAEIASA